MSISIECFFVFFSPCNKYILKVSNFNFRCVKLCDLDIRREKWIVYLQTVETLIRPASDLGLHCLPITLLGTPD